MLVNKKLIVTVVAVLAVLALVAGGVFFAFQSGLFGEGESKGKNKEKVKLDAQKVYKDYTQINDEALAIEAKYAEDGIVPEENLMDLMDELEDLAKDFEKQGLIESYDRQDTSISCELSCGVGYLYAPTVADVLAGDELGNILTIEPYVEEPMLIAHYVTSGKSPDKAAQKVVDKLPGQYQFTREDNWDVFSVEQGQQMGGKKIIIWYGHGNYLASLGPVLGTNIPVEDAETIENYDQMLAAEELYLGKENIIITPLYFENNLEDGALDGCMVFLAACSSAADDRLAQVLISKGASLVVGSDRTIRVMYVLRMMDDFFAALTNQYADGSYWTAEDALAYATSENGEADSEFWGYGAQLRLIYPEDKAGYRLFGYDNSVSDISSISVDDSFYFGINSGEHCYHIPAFILDDHKADDINDVIYDELYAILDEAVLDPESKNEEPWLWDMIYTWGTNGSIASIVVQTNAYSYHDVNRYIYNISIDTGKQASNNEVLAAWGLTQETYLQKVEETVTKYMEEKSAEWAGYVSSSEIDMLLENTIDELSMDTAKPFVNEAGHLCAEVGVHWPAGAGYERFLFDLTEQVFMEDILCTQDHGTGSNQTQQEETEQPQQTITEDQWKSAYLDYLYNMEYVDEGAEFCLFDMNGDNVPEMYISFDVYAAGSFVCTYDGQSVNELSLGGGGTMQYIPEDNLLWACGGIQGCYWDAVYAIQNGQWVTIGSGEYLEEETAEMYGDLPYYYWNNEEVSSYSDYEDNLESLFDFSRALDFYGAEPQGYYEFVSYLS